MQVSRLSDDRLYVSVRGVYNSYRTVLMNRKYYGYRLARVKFTSTVFDIALAVGTSAAIGSWALWETPLGKGVWLVMSSTATLIALVKPFLNLPARIERFTRLFAGHGVAYYDLGAIVHEITRLQHYTEEVNLKYLAVLERAKALSPEDDPSPNRRLLNRCYAEVIQQIPTSGLWWPPKGGMNVR